MVGAAVLHANETGLNGEIVLGLLRSYIEPYLSPESEKLGEDRAKKIGQRSRIVDEARVPMYPRFLWITARFNYVTGHDVACILLCCAALEAALKEFLDEYLQGRLDQDLGPRVTYWNTLREPSRACSKIHAIREGKGNHRTNTSNRLNSGEPHLCRIALARQRQEKELRSQSVAGGSSFSRSRLSFLCLSLASNQLNRPSKPPAKPRDAASRPTVRTRSEVCLCVGL
jgi:hypothetical protein